VPPSEKKIKAPPRIKIYLKLNPG